MLTGASRRESNLNWSGRQDSNLRPQSSGLRTLTAALLPDAKKHQGRGYRVRSSDNMQKG